MRMAIEMIQVTAAIITHNNELLIARRKSGGHLPGKWELPGGKVEPGETPEECLRRELNEELGIDAEIHEFFGESPYKYERGEILLMAYRVSWSGEMNPTAHDEIAWVPANEINNYDLAPADIPLIDMIFGDQDGI